ncbi:MAG: inositol monophosphatase family protein [Gemmatimonadaceae bacterium]
MSGSDWLDIMAAVTSHAGAVALRHFRTQLVVDTKRDGSPVTIADHAAERAARDWIQQRFPGDAIMGEEFGDTDMPNAKRRWVIDPIDGTKSYIHGVPLWGTMVGVMEDERFVAGGISCPAADELVVAAAAAGCWHNGSRCTVSGVRDIATATVLTSDERFRSNPLRHARWMALAERCAIARSWGDCYGYVLVATGRAELMVDDRLSLWDFAPLVPIITEAGGAISDWRGRMSVFSGEAIASNGHLAASLRDILCDREAVLDA